MKPGLALRSLLISTVALSGAASADVLLGEVGVTAKGYEADALETPAATLSLDGDALRRGGAHNPGEALRGQPGLAVAADSAQGQNPVIRGLKKESVVLLVDGVRLNSAQPAGAIASFLSLGLAERVEVVKGPASVLYGTGALGGVINVRLPQARFDAGTRLDAAASYDSASQGLRGTLVVNHAAGDHALMAGASLARIDDYRAPDGKVARSGYDSDSVIGQYRFRIDSASQLRVSVQQHSDRDAWYPGSTRPSPSPLVVSQTVHSPRQTRQLAELGYEWRGGGDDQPVTLDARVYRQEMMRRIHSRANGPLARDIAQTRVEFVTDGADLRATWLAHPSHLLSFGANTWRMEASPERVLPQGGVPANPLVRNDPFKDGRIDALGFYLQDDIALGRLNVLAGIRHDTVKGSAAAVGNPPVTTGLSRRDSAWSGSLGAIYEIAPLLRPYASLSRGFRAGEMRERFEASPRGDGFYYVGNPQIEPETATQIEIGVKGADGTLEYALSAYRNRISNYITGLDVSGVPGSNRCPVQNAAACKETINLGRAVLTGVEAQLRYRVATDHWLTAGYSRVRGDNKDLGEPLFQMPADEVSLGWDGRIAGSWHGDATLRLVRRQDRVATVFSRGSEDPTAGFATADIGVRYDWADQSLRVAVTNLADRRYHEHLTEGLSGTEIAAPGRSLKVTWQGRF